MKGAIAMTEPKRDLFSVGTLAGQLHVSVRAIEQAAGELDLLPALRLNGVVHFDGDQVERLTRHFAEAANP